MKQAKELIEELRIKNKKKEKNNYQLFFQSFFIFPRDIGDIDYGKCYKYE